MDNNEVFGELSGLLAVMIADGEFTIQDLIDFLRGYAHGLEEELKKEQQ